MSGPDRDPDEEEIVEPSRSEGEVGPAEVQEAPSRRDRAKPLELLAISAGCGVFAGLITLLVTRDWLLTGVMFGVAFIIGLVVLAMLSLGGYEPQQPPSPKGYLVDNERRQDEGH